MNFKELQEAHEQEKRSFIINELINNCCSITKTAQVLGIKRTTLHSFMNYHNINFTIEKKLKLLTIPISDIENRIKSRMEKYEKSI